MSYNQQYLVAAQMGHQQVQIQQQQAELAHQQVRITKYFLKKSQNQIKFCKKEKPKNQ